MFRPVARVAAPPCCSTSGRLYSAVQGQPALVWHQPSSRRRRPTHVCRASEDAQADDKDAAAEARLEAYERGAKRRQGALLVCAQAALSVLHHVSALPCCDRLLAVVRPRLRVAPALRLFHVSACMSRVQDADAEAYA